MEMLQHYTDRVGLEGIARTKTLWATNFLDLKDKSEFSYGFVELLKISLQRTFSEVPADKRVQSIDLERFQNDLNSQFRSQVHAAGSGHLYVTSFAKAKVPDHSRRGIRSLWKQVGEDGYCLEFSDNDIIALIKREEGSFNYDLIQLSPVSYEIHEDSEDFTALRFQLVQIYLSAIAMTRPDVGVKPQRDRIWTQARIGAELMKFCGRHKDPYYEDEREVRIFAIPSNLADASPITGIRHKKTIHRSASGKRYIDIGQGWRTGIEPRRILVGPRASPNVKQFFNHFRSLPEIIHVDVPELE
jgi:hypothetical protein